MCGKRERVMTDGLCPTRLLHVLALGKTLLYAP